MAKYTIEDTTLTEIADAIRSKEGSSELIAVLEMAQRILDIQTGIDTSDATLAEAEALVGETFYANGVKKTGTMINNGAVTQELAAGGSYNIPAGYHNGSGKVTAKDLASQTEATAEAGEILKGKTAYVNGSKVTGTINSKAAATITPGTQSQYIDPGVYISGTQTIKGDVSLKAANIKKGSSIFGVSGTFTSDGTAAAGDILSGKIAYVNGLKVTGTLVQVNIDTELTTQESLLTQIESALTAKGA